MGNSPENQPQDQPPYPVSDHARQLREQIAELRKRWPPHSAPPSLLQRLEDLEEELENELHRSG